MPSWVRHPVLCRPRQHGHVVARRAVARTSAQKGRAEDTFGEALATFELPAAAGWTTVSRTASIVGVLQVTVKETVAVPSRRGPMRRVAAEAGRGVAGRVCAVLPAGPVGEYAPLPAKPNQQPKQG